MYNVPQPELFSQGSTILDQFFNYLPTRPYCTDFLGVLKIRPKAQAIKEAYIQPNPITRAYWLVFDIDSSQSRYWPDEWHFPTPNIEIRNPENNHQHLFYMIDPAVYTLRQARPKPLQLAADVDRGLTRMLDADPGYAKLIAKNPLSEKWTVIVWHEKAWGLTELLDYIPDEIKKWRPKPKEMFGLGRNCQVFENTRGYAYAEWRRQGYDDQARLLEAVFSYAMNINNSFRVPMLDKEVWGISRSISKWTARHIDAAGFSAWQRDRNRESVQVRRKAADSRNEEIKIYYDSHPDLTRAELALIFHVSEKTIQRLKICRGG